MEILINELSLSGQFPSVEKFIEDALPSVISVLNEMNCDRDLLYKKYDFYSSPVTGELSIHDILIGNTSRLYWELRKIKSQLRSFFDLPYWENERKHASECEYLYNTHNVCGQSLAESCERDRVIISFMHGDFSDVRLSVMKNHKEVVVDNLFTKGHYTEVAYQRHVIPYADYFKWKFANGQYTLLDNTARFCRTGRSRQGQTVYKEITTGNYWYLDNLHKNHYEVFNSNREHVGIADLQGNINESERIKGRTV
jgi:hypothetical protein